MQKKRNLERLNKVLSESEAVTSEVHSANLMMGVPAGVLLKESGAEFPEEMTEDEWIACGQQILAVQQRSVWILIDWAKFGAGKWGDRYTELALQTGYSEKTLRNMLSVDSRLSIRKEGLDFGHHASVSSLPPAQQRAALDKAAKGKWTVQETREHVASKSGNRASEEPVQAHPEIKKLSRAMAYVGRISQDEIARMNSGEREVVQEIVDQLNDELQSIAKHLKS